MEAATKTDGVGELALDDAMIAAVVDRFYARVRRDPLLGPVFNGAVADWDEHLRKLADFWSSVMLHSGRYKGNPVAAHLRQQGTLTLVMFEHWLAAHSKNSASVSRAVVINYQIVVDRDPGARASDIFKSSKCLRRMAMDQTSEPCAPGSPRRPTAPGRGA